MPAAVPSIDGLAAVRSIMDGLAAVPGIMDGAGRRVPGVVPFLPLAVAADRHVDDIELACHCRHVHRRISQGHGVSPVPRM